MSGKIQTISVLKNENAILRRKLVDAELERDAARCIVREIRDVLIEHSAFVNTVATIDNYLSGIDPYSGVYEEKKRMEAERDEAREWAGRMKRERDDLQEQLDKAKKTNTYVYNLGVVDTSQKSSWRIV